MNSNNTNQQCILFVLLCAETYAAATTTIWSEGGEGIQVWR